MSLSHSLLRRLAICAILLVCSRAAGSAEEPDLPVSPEDRAAVIDAIAKQLETRYVIPEAVPRIVAGLRDKLRAGGYAETTAPAFARALTDDLRTAGRDLHFDVSYDPARERELSAAGAATRKRLREIEASPERLAQMRRSNYGFERVERLSGNVGYLDLRFFEDLRYSRDTAAGAMAMLAGSDAVIVDLRQNPGGYGSLTEFLVSYFFGERPVELMASYDRETDVTKRGRTLRRLPGKRLPDADVYLLTGPATGSAAEAFAFTLQRLGRARTVGERTAGAAHGGGWVPLGRGFVIFVPTFRGFDPRTGEDWEGVGVPPDVAATADRALEVAHVEAVRRLDAKTTEAEWKRQLGWLMPLLELSASGPKPVAVGSLDRFAGAYDRATIEVDTEGAHFIGAGGVHRRLLALVDGTFLIEDHSVPPENQARLRFVLDPQGNVTGLELLAPDGRVLPRARRP
jgi:retinol-binding protein 3